MRMGVPVDTPGGRTGMMLVPNEQGILIGKKQQTLEGVVPTIQDYDSAPVYRERTFAFKPQAGMGERVQSSQNDKRYYWGINIWVHGGLFGKGPLLHPIVPTVAAGGMVRQFVEGRADTGDLALYILAGDRVYRRNDDTNAGQVSVLYFAGVPPLSARRFKGLGAGAKDALYISYDNGTVHQFDGTTDAACALPSGFSAHFLEVVGDELWAADRDRSIVRKTVNDPVVGGAGGWGGPIQVGNSAVPISCLVQTGNRLVILKADGGVFTLNADGSDNDLYPGLATTQSMENGRSATSWLDSVWFRTGLTFFRLDLSGGGPVLQPVGPGRLLDNASPVRGQVQAFAGWGGYQAFAGIYNEGDATSYLLTYGNWQPTTQGSSGFAFLDQYDGALASWPDRRITAMGISNQLGSDRLYVGFADGGWDWFKLVRAPLAPDSGAEYTLDESYIVTPLHHAGFQADTKQWIGFSVFGPVLRTGDEVFLSYRLMGSAGAPPTVAAVDAGWIDLPGHFTHNGQRIDAKTNMASTGLSLKINIVNASTTATPCIDTIAVHERVVPAFKRDYSGSIDARPYVARRDGASVRTQPRQLRDLVIKAAAAPQAVTIELPDETLQSLAVFSYQERYLPGQGNARHSFAIDFQATQFTTIEIYGIIRRLRGTKIGELRGYSIALLRTL